ncbi:hypothetical protein [Marinicrinis sediminis]|uniref:CBM-cenC domain-containing protein n=1 Tax=Marinicrinis sediminis TaxID=1652465 RepID=A0ABW5R7P1_9BACL
MSSEKTTNLQLHKWQDSDYVLREEFNENFETLDTEIQSSNNRLDTVESTLNQRDIQSATLQRGTNLVSTDMASGVNVKKIEGHTLVNILGKDGSCESLTPFQISGTAELSSTKYWNGTTSIKLTSNGTGSTCFKDYQYALNTSKQYVLAFWVYVESYNSGSIYVGLGDVGTFELRYSALASGSKIGSWQLVHVKIPQSNTLVGNGFRLSIALSGTSTATAFFDAIRLYEVSSDLYNAIGTTYTTSSNPSLNDILPYVDSIQSLTHPYLIRKAKNLLPQEPYDYNEGTGTNSHNNIWENGKLAIRNGSTDVYGRGIWSDVIPNQAYTLSLHAEKANDDTSLRIMAGYSSSTNEIGYMNFSSGYGTFSFTPTQSPVLIRFLRNGATSSTSPVYAHDIMLNSGSIALPFEPQNEDMLLFETTLRSNPDHTVKDTLSIRDGKAHVTRKYESKVLDGSMDWKFGADYTGFKRVYVNDLVPTVDHKPLVSKSNGQILTVGNYSTEADSTSFNSNISGYFQLSISDTDSGWGETYTPSAAEIKAYFYGWKMTKSASGGQPYNGTGTKAWTKIGTDGIGSNGTLSLPTSMNDEGYTPYQLQYQLAIPYEEEVPMIGDLSFFDGDNQIELGEGLYMERATPVQSGNYYHINNDHDVTTKQGLLKYRAGKIIRILKDSKNATAEWSFLSDGSPYGNERVNIYHTNFDATATYTVVYTALDKYALTTHAQKADVEYSASHKSVLDQLVQHSTDQSMQVSQIKRDYAKKGSGQWLEPVLLNGWVVSDSTNKPKFKKDEFGVVHVTGQFKDGALQPSVCFVLPAGYRPVQEIRVPIVRNNDSSFSQMSIQPNGEARIHIGAPGTFAFHFSFMT